MTAVDADKPAADDSSRIDLRDANRALSSTSVSDAFPHDPACDSASSAGGMLPARVSTSGDGDWRLNMTRLREEVSPGEKIEAK